MKTNVNFFTFKCYLIHYLNVILYTIYTIDLVIRWEKIKQRKLEIPA